MQKTQVKLGHSPSTLVRISKENGFSRCLLSLKLFPSRPSFDVKNGYYSPLFVQGFVLQQGQDHVFSRQRKGISVAASKLGLIFSPFDPGVYRCNERVVFAEARFTFAAAMTPCLDLSVCIQIGIFYFLFVHFHTFYNLHAKSIKLT